jgi:hypothetical protein
MEIDYDRSWIQGVTEILIRFLDLSRFQILNQINCPPYFDELKKVFTHDLAELNAKNQDLFAEISKGCGNNITHLGELWQIYNIIRIEVRPPNTRSR